MGSGRLGKSAKTKKGAPPKERSALPSCHIVQGQQSAPSTQQANASQHLAVLRSKHVVTSRKEGNQAFYSLRDPVLIEVLDILKRYFYSQLSQTMSMLNEVKMEKAAKK